MRRTSRCTGSTRLNGSNREEEESWRYPPRLFLMGRPGFCLISASSSFCSWLESCISAVIFCFIANIRRKSCKSTSFPSKSPPSKPKQAKLLHYCRLHLGEKRFPRKNCIIAVFDGRTSSIQTVRLCTHPALSAREERKQEERKQGERK